MHPSILMLLFFVIKGGLTPPPSGTKLMITEVTGKIMTLENLTTEMRTEGS